MAEEVVRAYGILLKELGKFEKNLSDIKAKA